MSCLVISEPVLFLLRWETGSGGSHGDTPLPRGAAWELQVRTWVHGPVHVSISTELATYMYMYM